MMPASVGDYRKEFNFEMMTETTDTTEVASDSDGPYVQAYRDVPTAGALGLRGPGFLPWLVWWGGVCSFAWLLWSGQCLPYLLSVAAAINVPLPAPLGQLPPLPDQLLLVYVWGFRYPLCCGSIWMAIRNWRHHPEPHIGELDQVWWSGVAALLLLAAWRGRSVASSVAEAFSDFHGRCSVAERPRRPFVGWLHPYFYRCLDSAPGVKIRRVSDHTTSFLDVWEPEADSNNDVVGPNSGDSRAASIGAGGVGPSKPLFFYVHGGGWKGGHARMTPHAPLLQALAASGWHVVSCEYRMGAWPEHLDDCLEALRFVLAERAFQRAGAEFSSITIAGASAGGHLASLLALRSVREGLCRVDSLVLFYPVLDPRDVACATARTLLPFPPMRLRWRQSFLSWFIEQRVLHNRREFWSAADPLWQLDQLLAGHEASGEALRIPRTLVVHGTCDSVVPIEHSRRWMAVLEAKNPSRHTFVAVPFARHTYDIMASCTVEAVLDGVVAWLSADAQSNSNAA